MKLIAAIRSMSRADRLWRLLIMLIGILYLANCFSPFRLTNDTVRYFALTENLLGQWPAAFGDPTDFLPSGYIYFLAGLAKCHILYPWVISLVQVGYLAGSLYFVKNLFGDTIRTAPFLCFVLLNWVIVKFTITPLSELQFLFFSTGGLSFFQRFLTNRKWTQILLAFLFCTLSILTRTAGIALFLALLIAFILHHRRTAKDWIRTHKGITMAIVVAGCAAFVCIFIQPKVQTYLSYLFGPLLNDPRSFITNNIFMHLMDWAEVFINIPYPKTTILLSPAWGKLLFILTGIACVVLVVRKIVKKGSTVPLPVQAYIIIYLLLIFNWPFFEARFWLPIFPLVAAILLQNRQTNTIQSKVFYGLWGFIYFLTGIFVMGYYTNLSFNRRALVEKHDAGKWQQEYRLHFRMPGKIDSASFNQKAFYLLQKYDR